MSFIELVKTRQSVRRYNPQPVEMEKLMLCLEAARLAPSANNSQPWRFIIVNKPEIKNQVAETTFNKVFSFNRFVLNAPAIIVMIIEKASLVTRLASGIRKKEWSLLDSGIAAEHFCLQAAELGLGTCMIGWFDENKLKALLNIPKGKVISLLITIGYPEENYYLRGKTRKPLETIVNYNKY